MTFVFEMNKKVNDTATVTARHRFALLLSLWVLALAHGRPAQAQIVCPSVHMSDLVFGAVKPLASQKAAQSILSYLCRNESRTQTYSAKVCFNIGAPAGQFYPRFLWAGSNTLQMQLYQDSGHTRVWGTYETGAAHDPPLSVELTLGPGESKAGTATLYGLVLPGQTAAIAGNYSANYNDGHIRARLTSLPGGVPPSTCNDSPGYFPFTITAQVQARSCTAQDVTVKLPFVSRSAFDRSPTAGRIPFTVSIRCDGTEVISGIEYQFSTTVPIVDATHGVIALDGTSTAQGVGIQVIDDQNRPIQFQHRYTLVPFTPGQLQYRIPLTAAYYRTGTVRAGSVSSVMEFTLFYR